MNIAIQDHARQIGPPPTEAMCEALMRLEQRLEEQRQRIDLLEAQLVMQPAPGAPPEHT